MKKFIIFDFETNGFSKDNSVLSLSAVKCNYVDGEIKVTDNYDRFYYSEEPYNERAIKVNKLSRFRVNVLRNNVNYPELYKDDKGFSIFCGGVDSFVAHNIVFDEKFVPFLLPNKFCTMQNFKKQVNAKTKKGTLKTPTLLELVNYFKIPVNPMKLHSSDFDVKMTLEVLKRNTNNKYFIEFINKSKTTEISTKEIMSTDIGLKFANYLKNNSSNICYNSKLGIFFIPELKEKDYSIVLEVFNDFVLSDENNKNTQQFRRLLKDKIL